MNKVQYDTDSWHYRLWMNLHTQPRLKSWYSKTDNTGMKPHNNYCAYWNSMILYFLIQFSSLAFAMAFLAYTFIVSPALIIWFLWHGADYDSALNYPPFIPGVLAIAMYYIFLGMYIIKKISDISALNADVLEVNLFGGISRYYDSVKNKYCPVIEFVEKEKEND